MKYISSIEHGLSGTHLFHGMSRVGPLKANRSKYRVGLDQTFLTKGCGTQPKGPKGNNN